MNKINFQDLPNETTPINSNNLNQLQTNVDNAKYELTRGTAIPSGADLDDYKTNGSFYASSATIAQSLLNCPEQSSFKLIVENTVGTNQFKQTIICRNAAKGIYTRTFEGSAWGSWNYEGLEVNSSTLATLAGLTIGAFLKFASDVTLGGITIPNLSRGMLYCYNSSNASLLAVDTTGKLYTVYKDGTTWKNGKIYNGGIEESGSNANGSYIKYTDGTMICRITVPKEEFLNSSSAFTTVQDIKIYRSHSYQWNYPAQFIDTDYQINIDIRAAASGARVTWARVVDKGKVYCTFQLTALEDFISTGVAYTNLTEVYITAIGSWK